MLTNTQINNFRITRQLGSGSYGLVFHAVDMLTDQEYAIKAVMRQQQPGMGAVSLNTAVPIETGVKKTTILQTQLYQFFKSFKSRIFLPTVDIESIRTLTREQLENTPHYRELVMHLTVHSHNNVVTIHQALESSLATFIVMDYYPRDLFTSIVNIHHFNNDGLLVKKVFLQLCAVVLHCHRMGVYHCDIKPENILLDSDDNVHLCDFGLSVSASELPSKVCVGSSYYMAPERVLCSEPSQQFPMAAGDIWSIGIILINLVCTRNPWLKADITFDTTFYYFVKEPLVLKKILPISEDLYDILISVLHMDPKRRPQLPELMEAVANCEHFTSSGPLAEVERLSLEQYENFLEGDCSILLRKVSDEYYSDDYFETEHAVSSSSEDENSYSSDTLSSGSFNRDLSEPVVGTLLPRAGLDSLN
ncbi:putative serine/threonine protein kinase SKS1 Ecym_6044 [Eremothecium cymbalariae DBVPG|uniref:Protein kinase domain-containing protein n=1 Tax=Eremothecium cymbalariae (strain CBS 270.75 / DBVPG 7215 / KCTC 17166 / NRRL Y-17582) TaxID=931890 RepID=G8JUW8_ERECY|nr:hypothetical protein Ecym_6044 [Eremothecium cymbalariae DBVPG\